MNIDLSIIIWMQEFFGLGSRPFWDVITNLGSAPVLVLIVGMVMWTSGTSHGLRILFAFMISTMTVILLKVLIMQPRPYYVYEEVQPWRDSDGLGMPSGHAGGAMGLWGTLALTMRKGWVMLLAAVLILLIGLSRIYFGVHSPSQVLVGWGIGLCIVLAIWKWERPVITFWQSLGLWGQLAIAIVSTLALIGIQTTVIAKLAASFEIPAQWTVRFQAAQTYEAALDGETLTTVEPLHLFGELGIDLFGSFFGMWLVLLYTTHRGGFENFTARQRVVNVMLGLVVVVLLVGLTETVKGIVPVEALLWVALPVVLGVGVPLIGKRFA